MTVIGITGPTGAGKTTVLQYLQEKGAVILDCDRIYYELLATNEALRNELTETFGDVFFPDGSLDRGKLGKLVFEDEKKLRELNTIIYYYMGLEVRKRLKETKAEGKSLAAIDAINLIDSGLGELCSITVAVTAPKELRLARIMARDGIDEAYALSRISAQQDDEYFVRRCHAVLYNDGTEQELIQKATTLFKEIL